MKKVMCRGHICKVGLCNKKIKIYWTIKGLIILFIKFQFSIRCNQTFKPLCISTSNIYLNLSLNPNDLRPHHLYDPNAFVSSPIRFMTPVIYIAEVSMHPIKLGPSLRTRQAWKPLVYLSGDLRHFCHSLDVLADKADVHTKEKS